MSLRLFHHKNFDMAPCCSAMLNCCGRREQERQQRLQRALKVQEADWIQQGSQQGEQQEEEEESIPDDFYCPLCDKSFKSQKALANHERSAPVAYHHHTRPSPSAHPNTCLLLLIRLCQAVCLWVHHFKARLCAGLDQWLSMFVPSVHGHLVAHHS